MWLLDASSRRLVNFVGDATEPYAILSHTWEKDEVSFLDIQDLDLAQKRYGYRKLDFACRQALDDGFAYVWIDTCCINKDSTSELSEAINSMYRWYYNASTCYAFIQDAILENDKYVLKKCRWFTRGWTLQETIAPPSLVLYNNDWELIGTRTEMSAELSRITGVEDQLLKNRDNLHHYCTAQRLAWASRRRTTRIEDQAYCLLGLLNINMPLLYGEGPKAFHRLQQEVLANADRDFSVLTWEPYHPRHISMILAPDIYCFRNAAKTQVRPGPPQAWSASWSANGLRAHLPVLRAADGKLCYIELQRHIWGRYLKLRKVQQPDTSIISDTTMPAVYEVVRDSPQHNQHLFGNSYAQKPNAVAITKDIVVTGFRSWNHYITFDLSENLQITEAIPNAQWYPEQLDFAFSAFVTGVPCVGAVLVTHRSFADPKVFAFALYVLNDSNARGACAWYDLPKKKFATPASRISEGLVDALLRIRQTYAVDTSTASPSSFASGQYTISSAIAHSTTCGGETMPMRLPVNQTVIKIWAEQSVTIRSGKTSELSKPTISRWTFEENVRYRQYENSQNRWLYDDTPA